MNDQRSNQTTFLEFSDLLTGYRASMLLMLAHRHGLFARIGRKAIPASKLCRQLGWDEDFGRRMLEALQRLEILGNEEDSYHLNPKFSLLLDPESPCYQGTTLDFEDQLFVAWQQLEPTIIEGSRMYGTENQSSEKLAGARKRYLGAMDEAAKIRSMEVWDCLDKLPEEGLLLDVGAGSGAYLREFLTRYRHWSAIYCDLPEIVEHHALHPGLEAFATRLAWCGCNLLSEEPSPWETIADQSCELVLLSNIIHCQGKAETGRLLEKITTKLARCGRLLIHDFFKDDSWRGALYDLHMMLNTYNGRTYTIGEILEMVGTDVFLHQSLHHLASGSTLLVLERRPC
jgi:hypothetical protein